MLWCHPAPSEKLDVLQQEQEVQWKKNMPQKRQLKPGIVHYDDFRFLTVVEKYIPRDSYFRIEQSA